MNVLSKIKPVRAAFSINEVASILAIGRTSIYKLISDGKLNAVHILGRRRVLRDDLEAFLKSLPK